MDGLTCPECCRGEIRRASLGGRKMRFRQIPDLELPASVEGPVCSECGELWMDAATTKAISDALQVVWSEAMTRKAQVAIEVLRKTTPQRELESLLGLSPGWLSKIKGGRETSAPTAAALMLLANEPGRVDELRTSWEVFGSAQVSSVPIVELDEVRVAVKAKRKASEFLRDPQRVSMTARGNAQPVTELWPEELVA